MTPSASDPSDLSDTDDLPACATGKTRLFVTADLAAGARIDLEADQSHYLASVLRAKPGEAVYLFNGRDGEWLAAIAAVSKKAVALDVGRRTRAQDSVPDLTLLFAPVKRARLDFMVQKAAELGVAAVRPVFTRRTNVTRIKDDRLEANLIEAAEQCGRLTVPRYEAPVRLDALLDAWPEGHRLLFCDEAGADGTVRPMLDALNALDPAARGAPWSILIGPEGGFDAGERARLHALPGVLPAALGPRIMRADTAAMAALTLWQAALGDLGGTG